MYVEDAAFCQLSSTAGGATRKCLSKLRTPVSMREPDISQAIGHELPKWAQYCQLLPMGYGHRFSLLLLSAQQVARV